jgi:prevent-host-death family protein
MTTSGDDAESIGIRELRQHASRYVAKAQAGQRVPVTVRGKLVAYLVPAEEKTSTTFQRMATAGQVRMGRGNGIAHLLPVPPAPSGSKSLTETLREMRDEERY